MSKSKSTPISSKPSVFASLRAGLSALRRAPRALFLLLAAQVVVACIFLLSKWLHLNAALFPKPLSLVLPFLLDVAVELAVAGSLCFAHETLVLGKPARPSAFILPCARGVWKGVYHAILTVACFILLNSVLTFLFVAASFVGSWLPDPLKLACVILYFCAIDLLLAAITMHVRASLALSPDVKGVHALLRDIKRWLPVLMRFSFLYTFIGGLLPLPTQMQSASPQQGVYSYAYSLLAFSLFNFLSYTVLPFLYRGRVPLAGGRRRAA